MKKKLLSIALVIALVAGALVPAVLAAPQQTTASVDLEFPADLPGTGNNFVFEAVGDLEADVVAGFGPAQVVPFDGNVVVDIAATYAARTIQVSMSPFEIDDILTLDGFELALTVASLVETGPGTIDLAVADVLILSEYDSFEIVTSATYDNALYNPVVTFSAVIDIPEDAAYRAGVATAEIEWTVVPLIP